MANDDHISRLKTGVKSWNQWREDNPTKKPDLSGVTLTHEILKGVNLSNAFLYNSDFSYSNLDEANLAESNLAGICLDGASLKRASLRNADLRKAHLAGSSLHYTNLSDARLTGAYLDRAILMGADLTCADLREAVLTRASLINVNLKRTNFSNSSAGETNFCDIDLREAIGIDSIEHLLPSTIGIDTIIRSKGQVTKTFLRGVGVPDAAIDNLSLLMVESEYPSCFIAHSSKDVDFAKRLHNDLQNNGVRCWFAPKDMKMGDKIRPTLDNEISKHPKQLLILSESSLKSQWVEQEVETALAEERKRDALVLIPIRVDDAVMQEVTGWPAFIRHTRHIGDFCNWHDESAYKASFARLLDDLKAERK